MNHLLILDILYIIPLSILVGAILCMFKKELIPVFSAMAFLSIFMHELFHKVVAAHFGYVSVIQAESSVFFVLMALIFALLFGIFVPPPVFTRVFGYALNGGVRAVAFAFITKEIAWKMLLIAIAGPIANFLIAVVTYLLTKLYMNELSDVEKIILARTIYLNMFLFVLNILPIMPGSDGYYAMLALQKLLMV